MIDVTQYTAKDASMCHAEQTVGMQHKLQTDSDDKHLVPAGHGASTCASSGADSTCHCTVAQHASLLVTGLHGAYALWVGCALHVRCAGRALQHQYNLPSGMTRQTKVSVHPGRSASAHRLHDGEHVKVEKSLVGMSHSTAAVLTWCIMPVLPSRPVSIMPWPSRVLS
jgi:hypothetical protein